MRLNGNAIRPGNIIEHKDRLWIAVKIQHTQPGKGGAYLQVELKDIRNGTKLNERFRASENVERVRLDQKKYQFLCGFYILLYLSLIWGSPSWIPNPMIRSPSVKT